ncbi:hypothetical protein DL766_005783 [Monosporascus sp. MC13-8B]|nr:hypothetical protein DL766_005783 [Monosporascus sp. MC13-8B]
MSLRDHPKAYGSAAVATAFVAGVLVTLGFKDLYPDLERQYQQGRKSNSRTAAASSSSSKAVRRRPSSFFWGGGPVALEDHESRPPSPAASGEQQPNRALGIADGIPGCIGNTPLVRLHSLCEATGRTILAKAEFLNGAGNSPKDRVALRVIEAAEARGLLVPRRGDTIYEGTVGSTGISLAALARARGYRCHICMPDDQAREKSDLLHHLGATVERVPVAPIASPDHFVNLARRRAAEHAASAADGSRGFFADQFESPFNHEAHYLTTGPEIWAQTGGRVDAFVAGAGTGGTISGVARYLKERAAREPRPKPRRRPKRSSSSSDDYDGYDDSDDGGGDDGLPRIILADPQGSGLYNKVRHGVMYSSTEREGTRRRQQVDSVVEGVGINRVTANFEAGRDLIDDAVRVTDAQACAMARWLAERDGVFAGSSTAVNCAAAVAAALRLPPGSVVVTVICDSGARHLSKFWRQIAEMGLEDGEHGEPGDLLKLLGLNGDGTAVMRR